MQRGVQLFLQWAMMQGVAMLLQNRYQRQRLYTRIALGKVLLLNGIIQCLVCFSLISYLNNILASINLSISELTPFCLLITFRCCIIVLGTLLIVKIILFCLVLEAK